MAGHYRQKDRKALIEFRPSHRASAHGGQTAVKSLLGIRKFPDQSAVGEWLRDNQLKALRAVFPMNDSSR